jgi:effector-binding domain-containing protein
MVYEISEEVEYLRHLAVVRFSASPEEIPQRIGPAFGTVFDYLDRHDIVPLGPPVGCYVTGAGATFEVRAGCAVDVPIRPDGDVEPYDLPTGESLTTVHTGPYDDLPRAYEALETRAHELGRELDTLMWEEYLTGPEVPPEQMRTAIHWPLKAAAV